MSLTLSNDRATAGTKRMPKKGHSGGSPAFVFAFTPGVFAIAAAILFYILDLHALPAIVGFAVTTIACILLIGFAAKKYEDSFK